MTKATIARHKARRNQLESELQKLRFSEVNVSFALTAKIEEVKFQLFKENCWISRNDPHFFPRFRAFLDSVK